MSRKQIGKAVPFAARLHSLRAAAGLSQSELARRAGLSRQALHQMEAGTIQPAWETVGRLADALGVSVAAFRSES